MPIGTKEDFKIYNRQFQTGMVETQDQNILGFNEASRNAIRLITESIKGDFSQEAFFKKLSSVSHRDITSTATVSPLKLEQGEFRSPKVNRRIGPVSENVDAFMKIEEDPEEFSYIYGVQTAEEVQADWLNTIVLAGATAMESPTGQTAGMYVDISGSALTTKTLTSDHLITARSKMGDRADRLVAWVMHSGAYNDLCKSQTADERNGDQIGSVILYGGSPATLGRPVIVTDSPSLIIENVDPTPNQYKVLALTENALTATQSEVPRVFSMNKTGYENLVMEIQGEYAFNTAVKGFAFTPAAANPDDATLGTAANWEYQLDSIKDGPGVMLLVDATVAV